MCNEEPQKICVWCATTATRKVGAMFLEQTSSSEQYVSDVLQPLHQSVMQKKKRVYLMQYIATLRYNRRTLN